MINLLPDGSSPESANSLPPFSPRRSGGNPDGPKLNINILASLRRHWVVFLAVLLVFLACGAYVIMKKSKPVYEAHSVIYISPRFPKMLASDSEVELPYDSYVQDQMQTVTRYDIMAEAISKLPYSIRHRSGPALPYEILVMQRTLEVKRIGSTYEVSVSLRDPSPNGLADVVNTVTDTYVEKTKNEEFYGLDERLITLRQEKDRLQKEMDAHLAEQTQLMQQLGVASVSTEQGATNPYDSTLQKVRDQLTTARMQRQAAEAQLDSLLKGGGSDGLASLDAAADDANAANATLSQMMSSLNTRRSALTQEMTGLRPDHPIYQKDKEELASIDVQMNDLRHKSGQHLQEKLRQEVMRTRTVELELTKELADKTHTATAAAPKIQRATELGPEIESSQKAFDLIDARIRDLELESSSPGSIHVSTKALPPLGPETSKLRLYVAALMFSSLFWAFAATVGIDLLDGRIYTSQDVEKVVGFHPLGVLLNDDQFRKEITSEYYFRLAAGIDHAFRTSGARTFLFTSPAHGSGTSTVVRKVSEKLRDLNLRIRMIKASPFEESEVLRDVAVPSDRLLQGRSKSDENRSLPLTPLTPILGNGAYRGGQEAPTSNPVVRALNNASEQCDVVLIDADPLPISAQTEYLARLADATVLVVKSSSTTKQELNRAARLLERLEVAGVAVILNKINLDRADRALRKEFRGYEQSLRIRRAAEVKAAAQRTKTSV
jgi:polysaccharide biosynthesis transport protein